MPESYHVPVMLSESVDGLVKDPDGIYIDLTFGGGGHSHEILNRLGNGRLFAFDQDPDVRENAVVYKGDPRFQFIDSNFRYFRKYLKMYGVKKVDGILADLGISSHQIDTPSRGFSTRYNANLDMRMGQEGDRTAMSILNNYQASDLQSIFSEFGEIKNARSLAQSIIVHRVNNPIRTVEQLNEICKELSPKQRINKYLAQVYQSLRIEVNEELEVLEEMLNESVEILKTSGRLVVISYHSLEDRLVKNIMNYGNKKGEPQKDFYGNLIRPFIPVNRKPITASEKEMQRNPRSRSAKLRIAERTEENG